MKIVMLGAPGAGKGTQAKKIADRYQIPHISTGDIFRSNIKNGTELGMKAKAYMDKGNLVPDSLTLELVVDRLNQTDCKNGYVLENLPLEKYKEFDSLFDKDLFAEISLETCVNKRISAGSTGPESVEKQIEYITEFLDEKGIH